MDLAEALGVKTQTIYNWRNNTTVPNERSVIERIITVFQLSPIEAEALILATGRRPQPQHYDTADIIAYLRSAPAHAAQASALAARPVPLHGVPDPVDRHSQLLTNPPSTRNRFRRVSIHLLLLWIVAIAGDSFFLRATMAMPLHTITDPQIVRATAQQWNPILIDTFDDNRHHWVTGERGDAAARLFSDVVDGQYRFTATALKDEGALAWDTQTIVPPVATMYLAFDMHQQGGDSDSDGGIALRMQGVLHQEDSYFLYLKQPTKRLLIRKLYDDLTTISDTVFDGMHDDQPNRIEIIAYDAHFWVYINGIFAVTVVDDTIPSGTLNFMMRLPLRGSTGTYAFDNLEIRTP